MYHGFYYNKYFNINDGKPGRAIYLNQSKKEREKVGRREGKERERKESARHNFSDLLKIKFKNTY